MGPIPPSVTRSWRRSRSRPRTRLCTTSRVPQAMACFGDSGGPQLQKDTHGRWELIGATSGPGAPGPACSAGPGLYTNVPAYTDWIRKTIKRNG